MAIWNSVSIKKLIDKYNDSGFLPKDNPFHQGDIRVRKPRINFEYTKDEVKELAKIAGNVLYFGETYAKVTTDEGLRIVKLRKYQIKVLRQFQYYRHNIWLASRQIGKSCDGEIEIRDRHDAIVFNGNLRDYYNSYVGSRRLKFKSFLCDCLPYTNRISQFIIEAVIALIDQSYSWFSSNKADTIKSIDIKRQRLSICKEGGKNKMYVNRVHYCRPDRVLYIELDDDTILTVSPEHVIHGVLMYNENFGNYENFPSIEAQYIQVGAVITKHNSAFSRAKVISIGWSYFKYSLYDLTTSKPHKALPDHWYNIDGIRVHNCVTSDTTVDVYNKDSGEYSTEQMFELFYRYKAKLSVLDKLERSLYRIINKLQHKYDTAI